MSSMSVVIYHVLLLDGSNYEISLDVSRTPVLRLSLRILCEICFFFLQIVRIRMSAVFMVIVISDTVTQPFSFSC